MTIGHASVVEGGLRNHRIDSVTETSGTVAAGVSFRPFSDTVKRFVWSPDAGMIARRGIGSVNPLAHDTGVETHSVTVAYLLQGGIASGAALYEALYRDADGLMETRCIIDREHHAKGGNDRDAAVRTYTVAEGAKPASARLTGDPGSPGPMEVEIVYNAAKVRSYEISQPYAATKLLTIDSVLHGYATITAEAEGGCFTEIFSGTSTAYFATIDAIYLSSTTETSTVQVTGTESATFATIYGSEKYNNVEGDRGVPTGATHTTMANTDYERFLGDTILYDSGSLALDINSVELGVDNSLTSTPVHNSLKQRITEGNRTIQVTATVMGETESHDQIERHLTSHIADIEWRMTHSTLTVAGAALVTPGDRVIEAEGAFMQLSNVFEGTGITIA